jgi:hypothetical protein
MQILYSKHIKNRLSLRKIPYSLPQKIYEQSGERYFDAQTGYRVAIMKVRLYKKIRDVMIAYIIEGDCVKLLTIHPLGTDQKLRRVKSGRWSKIDEKV